jgi:hypothetical protein
LCSRGDFDHVSIRHPRTEEMPLKPIDKSSLWWLALLALAPFAAMMLSSGGSRSGKKSYLSKEEDEPPARAASASGGASAPLPLPLPVSTSSAATTATVPGPVSAGTLALDSATNAVATQVRLLQENREADFRATFLPSVAISADQWAACRKRVSATVVLPDWASATDETVSGHRVKRVAVLGAVATGFHELDGRWLADRVWCSPP